MQEERGGDEARARERKEIIYATHVTEVQHIYKTRSPRIIELDILRPYILEAQT